jgi:hypothetical protein
MKNACFKAAIPVSFSISPLGFTRRSDRGGSEGNGTFCIVFLVFRDLVMLHSFTAFIYFEISGQHFQ